MKHKKEKVISLLVACAVFYFLMGSYFWVFNGKMPWDMDAEGMFMFSVFFPMFGLGAPAFWGYVTYFNLTSGKDPKP